MTDCDWTPLRRTPLRWTVLFIPGWCSSYSELTETVSFNRVLLVPLGTQEVTEEMAKRFVIAILLFLPLL